MDYEVSVWVAYVHTCILYYEIQKTRSWGPTFDLICWRGDMAYRWIVDGQFRHGAFPKYVRREKLGG